MMSEVILGELKGVVVAVLSGSYITIVYDVLRIFRRVIPHGNLWIGIEDFFFWIWTSLWVFSVLYRENDGSLRIYTILAMVMGMLLYHQTISEPLVGLFGKIIKKLKKGMSKIIMKLRWRNIDGKQDEAKKKI